MERGASTHDPQCIVHGQWPNTFVQYHRSWFSLRVKQAVITPSDTLRTRSYAFHPMAVHRIYLELRTQIH